jgi:hypothetical protein
MDRVARKLFSLSANKDCRSSPFLTAPEKVMEVIMAAAQETLS